MPQPLFLGILLHQRYRFLRTSREAQVFERDLIDREDRGGRSEFGAHVADGGAVRQRNFSDALSVEFDELPDHAVLAQHLGDGQDHVGCGGAGRDSAGQPEAHNPRDQHGYGLAQHGRLGFDAADAPAQHAQAVDHGGVGVRADAGVRVGAEHACSISFNFAGHHRTRQVLNVDLVHDAHAGRNHLEVIERRLAPAQELVALAVALVLNLDVSFQCAGIPEEIDLDGMVDYKLSRCQRVDQGRIAAEFPDGLPHGGEVHHAGHPGEILHEDPRRRELNFGAGFGIRFPLRQGADVVGGDVCTVLGAQEVLQQNLEAVGQARGALHSVEPEDLVLVSGDIKRALGAERIHGTHRYPFDFFLLSL